MALVTAQKRQALRLPTVDATVDSLDQLALLGVFQIETTAPALSTNLKRQILRLPIVDATVDENDAFAFLQTPQTAGTGPTIDTFSLAWTIDPTFSLSETEVTVDGTFSVTLGQLISGIQGTVLDAVDNPVISVGFSLSPRRLDILLAEYNIEESSSQRTIVVSLSTRKIAQTFSVRTISAELSTRRVVIA